MNVKDTLHNHVKIMSSMQDEFHENLKKVFNEYKDSLNTLISKKDIPPQELNFIIYVVTKYILEQIIPNFIANIFVLMAKCVESPLLEEVVSESIDNIKYFFSNVLEKSNLDDIKIDAMFTA